MNSRFDLNNLEFALMHHSENNKSFNQALDIGSCSNTFTKFLTRCFDVTLSFDARNDVALFDVETTKKFYVVDEHEFQGLSTFFEENFLHWEKKFNRKFDYREIMVETRTLDSLKTSPDFIKIDTEGSEPYILKGGMETISKYKPTILIEEMKNTDYSNILLPLGYEKIQPNDSEDDPVYIYRNTNE
mgnify:FL=1|jgi:hypothetical protein|tara:strand:+ start:989 stop:1549 length:561 start_codon:yes stop_codon:yes gene_type:complete